ncbi:PepSY-like domain-containing protein [uncultured Parabacteroides sp.]|jgi:hypothetical protein|uniref:PepSY-like domain-containing protein n=1 Tax=uncultured Parabacteroides sp. TaxID=512312 RepID=UPI002634C1D3|nr:PepSY-like domain-containing protein [uncultured Parabacteroides sp.]
MKTLLRALCLVLSLSLVSFFYGCSNDEMERTQEIEAEALPPYIKSFLSNVFPGLTLEKAEKINIIDSTSMYPYKVYLPYEITVEFNEEGIWQQVNATEQTPQEQLRPLLRDILSYIQTNHQNEVITKVFQKDQGTGVVLGNNKKLVFQSFESQFLGYELNKDEYTSLPSQIRNFISTHFPDVDYKEVLYKEKEDEKDKGDYTYLIYLENNMDLRFNHNLDWTLIEGNDQLLPASLIESLPEKVKEMLQEYSDVAVTRMAFFSPEYHIRISSSTTVIIDLNAKPVVIPYETINKFVKTYFGELHHIAISHPLHEDRIIFNVSIPNGFDFTTDEAGQWFKMNGHGYPVPESLIATLPSGIHEYVSAQYDAKITRIEISDHYLIVLTDGTGLLFDRQGIFINKEKIEPGAYDKAYSYIRYRYPEDLNAHFSSWNGKDGFTFNLGDGTVVKFDLEGNLIE